MALDVVPTPKMKMWVSTWPMRLGPLYTYLPFLWNFSIAINVRHGDAIDKMICVILPVLIDSEEQVCA
jgi:hypothetical protein